MKKSSKNPPKGSKEQLYSQVFGINYTNADEFERYLKSKNVIKHVIALLFVVSISGWIFFYFFSRQSLISCLIVSYGTIWTTLYYCYLLLVLHNWRKSGNCKHRSLLLNCLRWILDISLITPGFYLTKLTESIAIKTNTHNVYKYAFESVLSILFAALITLHISVILMPIVINHPEILFWRNQASSLLEDKAFLHCSSLLIWILYKVIRNLLLCHYVKKSIVSKELGDDGCLRVYNRIKYELDTYGLMIVLVLTIISIFFKFSSNEPYTIFFSIIDYICLIYTAYLTCVGHFN